MPPWIKRATVITILPILLLAAACLGSSKAELPTASPAVVSLHQETTPASPSVTEPTTPQPAEASARAKPEKRFSEYPAYYQLAPTHTRVPNHTNESERERELTTWSDVALEQCRLGISTRYPELAKLDPDRMTDWQRPMWRHALRDSTLCFSYLAEKLSPANADKRNWQFQAKCFSRINDRKNNFYRYAGDNIREGRGHPDTVNQYVRVMNYLELTGPELLAMPVKPHEEYLSLLFGKNYQSRIVPSLNPEDVITYRMRYENSPPSGPPVVPYQAISTPYSTEGLITPYEAGETPIPTEWLTTQSSEVPVARRMRGETIILNAEQIKWYGYGYAFQHSKDCHRYFPQMFSGYWIPLHDERKPVLPVPELEGERTLLVRLSDSFRAN